MPATNEHESIRDDTSSAHESGLTRMTHSPEITMDHHNFDTLTSEPKWLGVKETARNERKEKKRA